MAIKTENLEDHFKLINLAEGIITNLKWNNLIYSYKGN